MCMFNEIDQRTNDVRTERTKNKTQKSRARSSRPSNTIPRLLTATRPDCPEPVTLLTGGPATACDLHRFVHGNEGYDVDRLRFRTRRCRQAADVSRMFRVLHAGELRFPGSGWGVVSDSYPAVEQLSKFGDGTDVRMCDLGPTREKLRKLF